MSALLFFVPLALGIAWLFYLVFRANLAVQPLGRIISYFVGVLIIILVVGLFVDNFPTWALQRLNNTRRSAQWREFVDTSTTIIEESLDGDNQLPPTPVPQGNFIPVQPTATISGISADPANPNAVLPTQYVVVPGDTLIGIADKHGTTVEDLMLVNGLTSYIIYPGDVLNIPATSRTTPNK